MSILFPCKFDEILHGFVKLKNLICSDKCCTAFKKSEEPCRWRYSLAQNTIRLLRKLRKDAQAVFFLAPRLLFMVRSNKEMCNFFFDSHRKRLVGRVRIGAKMVYFILAYTTRRIWLKWGTTQKLCVSRFLIQDWCLERWGATQTWSSPRFPMLGKLRIGAYMVLIFFLARTTRRLLGGVRNNGEAVYSCAPNTCRLLWWFGNVWCWLWWSEVGCVRCSVNRYLLPDLACYKENKY